ncbi:hypothetical protein V8F33_002466 [Rhypophila sp. PSN 637]
MRQQQPVLISLSKKDFEVKIVVQTVFDGDSRHSAAAPPRRVPWLCLFDLLGVCFEQCAVPPPWVSKGGISQCLHCRKSESERRLAPQKSNDFCVNVCLLLAIDSLTVKLAALTMESRFGWRSRNTIAATVQLFMGVGLVLRSSKKSAQSVDDSTTLGSTESRCRRLFVHMPRKITESHPLITRSRKPEICHLALYFLLEEPSPLGPRPVD